MTEIRLTKIYLKSCPLRYNKVPGITVTAIPVPAKPNKLETNPPTAPPINPIIKGFTYLKLTPKMAGSVIPKKADNAEGNANAFNFFDLVFNPTAKVAPPCAAIAQVIIALKALLPKLAKS